MTIHHDKLAYGKLAKTSEEMSEEELLKMLKELNSAAPDDSPESPEEDKENK